MKKSNPDKNLLAVEVTSTPPPGEFARIVADALRQTGLFHCDCPECECTRKVEGQGDICAECQKGEHTFYGTEQWDRQQDDNE